MNLMPSKAPAMIDFNQATQCRALLNGISVTDLEDSRQVLFQLLEGMATADLPPLVQLSLLEEVRPLADYVLGEFSRRYASRPLPPTSGETDTLSSVIRIWTLLATNYNFVAQRSTQFPDPALEDKRALIAHRRMATQAQVMIEYFRARQEIPQDSWHDLHSLFVSAERADVAQIRVPDPLNETWGAQSAQEAYISMLLIDASSPYSRTPREFNWIIRWARRFAPYCGLHDHAEAAPANAYIVDTASDSGLRPAGTTPPTPGQRLLNPAKLAAHLQAVVSQLKSGVAAASLGLGDDCVQPACARLIVSLYRPWGLASTGRKFPRKPGQGHGHLCVDQPGIAFFLTGTRFEQPEEELVRYSNFARTEAMLALGERAEEVSPSEIDLAGKALTLGYALEPWEILDQSVTGLRLQRQQGQSRLEHRQLVGVRTDSQERMMLAEISWLMYRQSGMLECGVSLMPAPPVPVPVRLIDPRRNVRERFRLGFLVPGVPALKTDPTIIVPVGWYVSDRRLEIRGEVPWFARMTRLVSRGANFDRVVFSREDAPVELQSAP